MPTERCLAVALAAAMGCLPTAEEPAYEPMCASSADCDSGASCDEGICWGNPPARRFAAVLVPPGEGWPELAPTEIPELAIGADGWVADLTFARTATFTGRVVLACGDAPAPGCDSDVSIDAQISVTRPSRIPGRPAYTRTVTSVGGLAPDEPSFRLTLPVSDEPYQVTVIPTRGASLASVPPALAPPVRFDLDVDSSADGADLEWALGDPATHKIVTGRVVDAVGQGIADMQVFAVDPSHPLAASERRSSIAVTDPDGAFDLRIPLGVELLDLVAMPVTEGDAPTLRMSDVSIPEPVPEDVAVPIELPQPLQMPSYGAPAPYTLPIRGRDRNGNTVSVSGATVRVTTYLPGLQPDTTATFSTRTFTDDQGNARLDLIPGSAVENRTYVASVEPLPNTEHAALHGHMLDIGSEQGGFLATLTLPRRVAVGGAVYTAAGEPAYQTTVTASLSAGFRLGLQPEARSVAEQLQLSSARTDMSGRFLIWLDETLVGSTAAYDLELTPADPLAPLWSVRGVTMSRRDEAGSVELEDIELPGAAYARGTVVNPAGAVVPEASLRLYEVLVDQCSGAGGCAPRVVFRGLSTARDDGQVRLILPE